MSNDLAIRTTVRELCTVFAAAEADVRAAFAAIDAAEERLNKAFMPGEHVYRTFHVSACGTMFRDNFKDADQAVRIMTRDAWRSIVERLELKRFMSIKRWEALQKSMDEETMPAITEENVMAFARAQLAQARDMLKEAVDEVFEWLRPHKDTRAGALKTNSELEVPSKVILEHVVERGFMKPFQVHHRRRQHLIALENVFSALDGRGEICKGYQSLIQTAIEASSDGEGETELFAFRACKNGNLHLSFRRLDLLARFNQIAGGKRLRPAPTEEDQLRTEVAKARAENERLKRAHGAQ